ncbi:MAG TPA: hypothetical protein PLK94_05065 [Alphaproteobacteria bacterium]|nr:hypothetical protein [Alphaproteobacteria bacterium]HOO50644.1 hypothetical protein [Alphaproteobacteria bacterium]
MAYYTVLIENISPDLSGHFLAVCFEGGELHIPTTSIDTRTTSRGVEKIAAETCAREIGLRGIFDATNLQSGGVKSYVLCFAKVDRHEIKEGMHFIPARYVIDLLEKDCPENVKAYLQKVSAPKEAFA